MTRPEVSIAIVLYNSADGIRECLRSIRGEVDLGFAELVAADNASPDDSVSIVRAECPGAQVIEMDQNRGFAAGVNAALVRVRGRYWLLLNPDVRVPAEGLSRLVAWMDAHPNIAVASPNIVDLGPLREELFMYGEDLEWCWRMRRAGWRIGVCSSTTFVHATSSSARRTFGADDLERRIAQGTDAACRLMYGPRHARVLAGLTALTFALDARLPGKSPEERARSRAAAVVWRGLAARAR